LDENAPSARIDYPGLQWHESRGTCGPDVTDASQAILAADQNALFQADKRRKMAACTRMVDKKGWNIVELAVRGQVGKLIPGQLVSQSAASTGLTGRPEHSRRGAMS
jgi:hypothetical protein